MRDDDAKKPKGDPPWRIRATWLEQVATDKGLRARAFKVAWGLCRWMNEKTRSCHPAQSTIGVRVGLSARIVRQAIRELEEAGHLVSDQQQRTSVYTMMVGEEEIAFGRRHFQTKILGRQCSEHSPEDSVPGKS